MDTHGRVYEALVKKKFESTMKRLNPGITFKKSPNHYIEKSNFPNEFNKLLIDKNIFQNYDGKVNNLTEIEIHRNFICL